MSERPSYPLDLWTPQQFGGTRRWEKDGAFVWMEFVDVDGEQVQKWFARQWDNNERRGPFDDVRLAIAVADRSGGL